MSAYFFDRDWCRPLQELDQATRFKIVSWALRVYDRDVRYYRTMFAKGRTCLEYVEGKIFSPDELGQIMEREDIPVQTPELKPALDAIMGELLNTGKSGAVTAVGSEDAQGAFIRTVIIKAAERENQLRFREAQVARDTFITSVPGWVCIEAHDPNNLDEPGISVTQEDWDAVVPDASWTDRQLRDLTHATRIRRWGKDEIDAFVQDDFTRDLMNQNMDSWAQALPATYDGRAFLIEMLRNNRVLFDQTGRLGVFEMVHWVRMRTACWYDPATQDGGPLPANWNDAEVQQWQAANPKKQMVVNNNQKVLWVTTFTGGGHLLAHGPHWNQSGIFPWIPCVPDRLNGKWAGLVEFVLDTVKAGAYAETEWANSIRTLNNNLLKVKKGAIKDLEEARRQMAMKNGIVEIEPQFSTEDVKFEENHREQTAFLEWKNATREQLSRLLVPDNFVGGVQSSQEANAAIQTRIDQTLSRLAPVVWGWHAFRLQIRRVIAKSIPWAITTNKVYRYVDPLNGMQQVEVNKPITDPIYGVVVGVMNDLSADEYDYIETESDDSLTGQEMQRRQFKEFMGEYGNMPPNAIIALAKSYPSTVVQQFGAQLEEQMANQKTGPDTKLSASLDINGLAANPIAQKVAVAMGLLSPDDLQSLSTNNLPGQQQMLTFGDGGPAVPQPQGITMP